MQGEQVRWMVDDSVGLGHDFLPATYTDTSLVDGERTIIVDCNWTPTNLQVGRSRAFFLSVIAPRLPRKGRGT